MKKLLKIVVALAVVLLIALAVVWLRIDAIAKAGLEIGRAHV